MSESIVGNPLLAFFRCLAGGRRCGRAPQSICTPRRCRCFIQRVTPPPSSFIPIPSVYSPFGVRESPGCSGDFVCGCFGPLGDPRAPPPVPPRLSSPPPSLGDPPSPRRSVSGRSSALPPTRTRPIFISAIGIFCPRGQLFCFVTTAEGSYGERSDASSSSSSPLALASALALARSPSVRRASRRVPPRRRRRRRTRTATRRDDRLGPPSDPAGRSPRRPHASRVLVRNSPRRCSTRLLPRRTRIPATCGGRILGSKS